VNGGRRSGAQPGGIAGAVAGGGYGPIVTERDAAPADPRVVAALEDVKPYLVAVGAVAVLGTPADFAVPIMHRLRRRSGISLGA
jgi:hypothetical protein